MSDQTVLVTGISGFMASNVAKKLLENGYKVKGTVRSLTSSKCEQLKELFTDAQPPLQLVECDLTKEDGWESAMEGVDVLMHVASPFPNVGEVSVKEEDVIDPAIEGTMRALKAAVKAKIKKVVLTSSVMAICGDSEYDTDKVYSEEDWADTESFHIDVYSKSKTLAEKAAWDYVKELPDEEKLDLSVINPSFVLGPVLLESQKDATSVNFLSQILNRAWPGHPRLSINFCDVRDVAEAHVKAINTAEASGKRHIVFSKSLWMRDVAAILGDEFRGQGYSIATAQFPYVLVWVAGCFNKAMRSYVLPRFGKEAFIMDSKRMTDVLHIESRPIETTINDMAYSIIDLGIVKKAKKYKEVGSRAEIPAEKSEEAKEGENEPQKKDDENEAEVGNSTTEDVPKKEDEPTAAE